jgi:hypothetical protein
MDNAITNPYDLMQFGSIRHAISLLLNEKMLQHEQWADMTNSVCLQDEVHKTQG